MANKTKAELEQLIDDLAASLRHYKGMVGKEGWRPSDEDLLDQAAGEYARSDSRYKGADDSPDGGAAGVEGDPGEEGKPGLMRGGSAVGHAVYPGIDPDPPAPGEPDTGDEA
jgi:hypothetical protein